MISYVDEINNTKKIDTHAHIGAIGSIGFSNKNPMGSVVDLRPINFRKQTDLSDLLLAPYLGGLLFSLDFNNPKNKDDIWGKIKLPLKNSRGTGTYIALNRSCKDLYNISLNELFEDDNKVKILSDCINKNYSNGLYEWTNKALSELNIIKINNPVHLKYINNMDVTKLDDLFNPILRVDDLLGYPTFDRHLDWSYLNAILDMEIRNIYDLNRMVDKTFKMLINKGVNGIKQLQAYSRKLEFKKVSISEVLFAFNHLKITDSINNKLIVQDYIMDLILQKAEEYKLPYQIHTGMANLPNTNPAFLCKCIERYPNVKFVLLHCYPYLSEAAYMARTYKNVYLDTAWLALQSPSILRKALEEWVGFVPYTKICVSCDATNVEESYGSYMITRDILNQVLVRKTELGYLDKKLAIDMIRAIYYENAKKIYWR